MGHEKTDQLRWLGVLLSIVVSVCLSFIYVLWDGAESTRFGQFILALIPNAVVVLIAFPIVYFLFTKHGIEIDPVIDVDSISRDIVSQINSQTISVRPSQILAFHDTFRDVDWRALLADSQTSLDIVVYYFDSWVNQNHDSLKAFFRKPKTTIRVFLADPMDDTIITNIARLFPDSSSEVVREKVKQTGDRLRQVAQEAGADPRRVKVLYVPFMLNYSAQVIDNRILVLSIFEMFRKKRIDSPAFVIDLAKSEKLTHFWEKELEGLIASAK